MTTEGISNTGEGSGAGGVCQRPQTPSRWVQTNFLPVPCFTVRLDVHTLDPYAPWCFSIEVKDAHSRELLAKELEPSRASSTPQQRISHVLEDLRVILQALTDPEPF